MSNQRYRNIKNGNVYVFVSFGIDCTNERDGTKVVIYYPESNTDFLCVREENEFFIKFEKI